ncbi:hypothetical protein EYF80_035154 [Liparis tanakae]|uniref:Uncharacterized protein n=1 Tax=Liparis tanakae TaxID=230148 RepID=A0A4Z2GPP7_9TELE|nr:hypothetical protein EYF80_035154 [Liparis tanakae]
MSSFPTYTPPASGHYRRGKLEGDFHIKDEGVAGFKSARLGEILDDRKAGPHRSRAPLRDGGLQNRPSGSSPSWPGTTHCSLCGSALITSALTTCSELWASRTGMRKQAAHKEARGGSSAPRPTGGEPGERKGPGNN